MELKVSFDRLYEESDTIISAINNIPKTNENIDTIRRLSISMNNVKKYVVDYITKNFDSNSYIDNYSNQIYDTVKIDNNYSNY